MLPSAGKDLQSPTTSGLTREASSERGGKALCEGKASIKRKLSLKKKKERRREVS